MSSARFSEADKVARKALRVVPRGKVKRGRSKSVSKYKNERVTSSSGEKFDSKAECRRYEELLILQRAGKISDLKRQTPIGLIGADGLPLRAEGGRRLVYRADFTYIEDGKLTYEDRKGYKTKDFKLKMAILRGMGIELRLT